MTNHPNRSKDKRIARMESQLLILRSALTHLERTTKNYDPMCTMGLMHERIRKALNDDFALNDK